MAWYTEIGVRSFGRGLFLKNPLTGADLGSKRVFRIKAGDLVVSNVFAWEGAVAVAAETHDGRIGSHRFMTWTPRVADVSVRYLNHYFASDQGLDQLRAASPGSAGRNRTLSIKNFEAIEVPLPDLAEQQRIAAHLDSITSSLSLVVRHSRRLPSRLALRRFVTSALAAESTEQWRPGEHFELRGGSTPDASAVSLWDGGVPWVTPADIGPLATREISGGARSVATEFVPRSGLIPAGSVVMTSRAPIGNLAIAARPLLTNQGCKSFVPRADIEPVYLYFAVMSRLDEIEAAGTGTTFHEVSAKKLSQIALPGCPPAKQKALIDAFSRMQDNMCQLDELDRRAQGLQSSVLPAARNEVFSAMR